eukprot:3171717-Prymnesium_polylepis.1
MMNRVNSDGRIALISSSFPKMQRSSRTQNTPDENMLLPCALSAEGDAERSSTCRVVAGGTGGAGAHKGCGVPVARRNRVDAPRVGGGERGGERSGDEEDAHRSEEPNGADGVGRRDREARPLDGHGLSRTVVTPLQFTVRAVAAALHA